MWLFMAFISLTGLRYTDGMKNIAAHGRAAQFAAIAAAMLCGCATTQHAGFSAHASSYGAYGHARGHDGAAVHDGHGDAPVAPETTPALALSQVQALRDILPALDERRVVYIGETHDQYGHHLTQLAIIKHLYESDPRLAIGVEFFQQPFQAALDDFIAGSLDETSMLEATEYFRRWGYDYRLYAPILSYAREQGLPVIALNAPKELVEKVRQLGIDGLSAPDRARIPADIDRSDTAYAQRMREVFDMHAHQGPGLDFERFLDVQLLWDETMAQRSADFLRDHPDHRLVVLAGSGHLANGSGIPHRVDRRIAVTRATVLNDLPGTTLSPDLGDYLLMPQRQELPPAGRMGLMLEDDERGVKVASCMKDSACASVDLRVGDYVLALDGVKVTNATSVQALMWERKPGDSVTLTVRRDHWWRSASERERELTLVLR
jgi:uncharacterized iron-regulated protein